MKHKSENHDVEILGCCTVFFFDSPQDLMQLMIVVPQRWTQLRLLSVAQGLRFVCDRSFLDTSGLKQLGMAL